MQYGLEAAIGHALIKLRQFSIVDDAMLGKRRLESPEPLRQVLASPEVAMPAALVRACADSCGGAMGHCH